MPLMITDRTGIRFLYGAIFTVFLLITGCSENKGPPEPAETNSDKTFITVSRDALQNGFIKLGAEKNIAIGDYAYSRLDTIVGCIVVNVVAACIMVVCALTLHKAGLRIETAADAARALTPLAGQASSYLFAFGLWNASRFAASILPLSTSYTICEALGWESGVEKDFEAAPQFYVLHTAIIGIGAVTILLPGISFLGIMFWSQVINGQLLPVIVVMILLLVNDRQIMGEYTNGGFCNVICWVSAIVLTGVSIVYVVSLFLVG